MSVGAYVAGWAVLIVTLGPLGWATVEVRRWLLPGWAGPWARLAEVVAAAALLTTVAEAVGTVGGFRRGPLAFAAAAAGSAVAVAARSRPRRTAVAAPAVAAPAAAPAADRWALAGAAVAALAVAAQWLAFTAQSLHQGMTAYDAVFYHGIVAARFAQTGYVSHFHPVVPGEAVAFYPSTTELWHAVGILAFRSDLLSPLLNLGALGVALLSAWCLGRRLGGAPAAVAGVALVAALPYVALSQPGSSFDDFPALAALLASGALLSRAQEEHAAAAFAAGAAGLAAGIKLSFLAPAVLLALVATALSRPRRRPATAAAWGVVMSVTGGYWYVRDLVLTGSPLPGLHIPGLRGPSFPVDRRYGTTLFGSHLAWAAYHSGLRDYFGKAWPGLLAVVPAAVVLGWAAGHTSPWHRALAVAIVVGAAAYAATPVTGDPMFFRFNLRYSLPVQALAVVVVATAPAMRSAWAQRSLVALVLAALALDFPGPTAGHRDAFELGAWPDGHRVAAVAVTAALAAIAATTWALWRTRRTAPTAARTAAACVAGVTLAGAIAVAGRGVADRYQAGRYRGIQGELAVAWAWAQTVHHSRIGVVGIYQQYPLTGSDISNVVQYVGVVTAHRGFEAAPSCATFRRLVDAGHYRYLVTSRDGILPPAGDPREVAWIVGDHAATQVLHVGNTRVFGLSGPLSPSSC